MAPLRHVSYVLLEHPSLICLSVGYLIAPPPSPTSLSPTQAPLVTPMLPMAGLIMHRHVLIALFRFHLPTLADTILRFSHCISTYSNGALNPPRIVASATCSRGRVCVTGVGIETVVPPLPTPPAVYLSTSNDRKSRPPSTHGARAHTNNSQRNSNSSPITFTSTTANAAATSTPSGVTWPLLWPCSCSSSCSYTRHE